MVCSIHSNVTRPGSAIGYLQQSERLLPWRTVLENVGLGLELLGEDKIRAQIKSRVLLDQVGMLEFSSLYPYAVVGWDDTASIACPHSDHGTFIATSRMNPLDN